MDLSSICCHYNLNSIYYENEIEGALIFTKSIQNDKHGTYEVYQLNHLLYLTMLYNCFFAKDYV